MSVDRLASEERIRLSWKEANSLVGRGEIRGKSVLLAKPLSYMNLSGGPVRSLLERHEIPLVRLVVVYDDLALPWKCLRIRERGSAGGHKGIASIIDRLGGNEFPRLRLGIGPGRRVEDAASFVLKPFRPAQKKELDEMLGEAVEALRLLLSDGAAKAMTVVNRRAEGQEKAGYQCLAISEFSTGGIGHAKGKPPPLSCF